MGAGRVLHLFIFFFIFFTAVGRLTAEMKYDHTQRKDERRCERVYEKGMGTKGKSRVVREREEKRERSRSESFALPCLALPRWEVLFFY